MERVTEQTITRKLPGSNTLLEYKVIDNPNKLAEEDWASVVAIFATGQLWQFKGWKWEDPRTLFANILGVHLTMDDTAVTENILQWNCKVLKINRTKRHSDAIAMNKFWGHVDSYVEQNRPEMFKLMEKQIGVKR
jgi:parafibromin